MTPLTAPRPPGRTWPPRPRSALILRRGAPQDKESPCHLADGALPHLRGGDSVVRNILARGTDRRHRDSRRQLVGGDRPAHHLQHVPALLLLVYGLVNRGSGRDRHLGGGTVLRLGPRPRAGSRAGLPGPGDPGPGHHAVLVRRGDAGQGGVPWAA